MERDFLGINGKDSASLAREEGRGSRQDSGGPAVQWPSSNKLSALQQFMSFKVGQEERAKKLVFDHLSPSGFQPTATVDAVDANYKACPVQAQQKCFTLDKQGVHQFPMHAYQSQSTTSLSASTHNLSEAKSLPMVMHRSIPIATSSPFFKVHGSPSVANLSVTALKQQFLGGVAPVAGSMVGAFAPRNVSRNLPTTAQLTIFYAGSVNVYDGVPLDKAQAIMFLASQGSSASSNAVNPRPEAPAPTLTKVVGVDGLSMTQTQTQAQTQNTNHMASPCAGISSTTSVTSHTGAHSRNGCSTTDDLVGVKSVGPSVPNNQHEPSQTTTAASGSAAPVSVMPRAIPQARKASLARFLEKRKERVTIAAPYSGAKKPPENTVGFDGPSGKTSSTDIALSSNHEEFWSVGCQNKSSTDSVESPSTKLEM